MEIKIQSIHFDATEKLQAFIEKKVAKLEKTFEGTLFGSAGHECFRSRGGWKGRGGFPVVTF